jgi:hypothetical protein
MRKRSLCIALLCVVFGSALVAQQGTITNVTIRVTDGLGAVIPHAQIRFMPAPDSVPPNLETDDHGERGIELRAGGYTLSISARGFKTYTRHIDVKIPGGQFSASQFVPVALEIGHTDGPYVDSASLLLTADPYHAPLVLSPADFRALPHITITVHNGHTNTAETYAGVPLATLLAKVNAPLGKELHGEAMTSYVVASGSDGYSVVLSLAEVDPSFHEGQVIVADTRDGQPLGKSGPFQLIVSDDKRPARWVHNLESITLKLK